MHDLCSDSSFLDSKVNVTCRPQGNSNGGLQRNLEKQKHVEYGINVAAKVTNAHNIIIMNLHRYLSLRSSDESVSLEQLNESHLSLQSESQPHPNTDTWAKTKWHVAKLRPLGFFLRRKPSVI